METSFETKHMASSNGSDGLAAFCGQGRAMALWVKASACDPKRRPGLRMRMHAKHTAKTRPVRACARRLHSAALALGASNPAPARTSHVRSVTPIAVARIAGSSIVCVAPLSGVAL